MKTITDVQKDLEAVRKEARRFPNLDYDAELNKLRSIVLYLETAPTERFVNETLDKKRWHLHIIKEGFDVWLRTTPSVELAVKNPKAKYHNLMGYALVKKQIKNLEYILN